MSVTITIRDVPEHVRDELASRAALQGRSMQDFLKRSLEAMASRPSPEQWLNSVRERKQRYGAAFSSDDIIEERDKDLR